MALVLSVLLYCYALIMGTSDAVLPWALKILMIALVTVAAFIYRKPFQHLFSAVGYGVIGSQQRAEADLARAGATARASTGALAAARFLGSLPTGPAGGRGAIPARLPAWRWPPRQAGSAPPWQPGCRPAKPGRARMRTVTRLRTERLRLPVPVQARVPAWMSQEAGWHWRPEVVPRSEGSGTSAAGWPAARPSRPRSTCRPATARPQLARPQLARSQLARSQPPRAVRLRQARLVFRLERQEPGRWGAAPAHRWLGQPRQCRARLGRSLSREVRPSDSRPRKASGPRVRRRSASRLSGSPRSARRLSASLRSVSASHRASHRKARRRNASGRSASHPQDRHHSAAACGPAGQTAPLRRVSRGGRLPGGRQSERPAQSGRLPAGRISPRASNPRVPVRSRRAGRPPTVTGRHRSGCGRCAGSSWRWIAARSGGESPSQ